MRSVLHQRGKVFGILLCVVLTLSVYAGFVGVVNELFGDDFIQAISLSSQAHSKDDYRFAMGDTIIVSAKVKKGNAYRLDVYDNSDRLVYGDMGGVNGSDVRVPVPVRPSAFNASQVYKLTFQAGLVNYPLPGIGTYDYAGGPFGVVKSLTRLNLTASYDAVSHELEAVAFLITNDTVPVENRTVSLYTQPDLDLALNNKGWVCLGRRQTDENGTALFNVAVNARGGAYGLEARFAGDGDFGASTSLNATSFVEVSPVPLLHVVKVETSKGAVHVLLRVTDSYNFPLGGRLLSYEASSLGEDPLYAISDGGGYASVAFNVGPLLSFVDSKISVLGDPYTSRLQAVARLNLTGPKSFFEGVSSSPLPGALLIDAEPAKSGGVEKISMSTAAMLMSYPPVSVSLDSNPAMADLPETISVDYTTSTNQGSLQFQFSQNGTFLASVHAYCVRHRLVDPDGEYMYSWEYSGTLVWQPSYYGGCSISVSAVDATNFTVAQGSSGSFSISPAPVNLVVYYPETFCGSSLDLSVALSRSRVYEQEQSSFFQSCTLAPSRQWVGNTYMLDCGDNSTAIEVYVNGSRRVVVPDGQGFARVQVPVGSLVNNGSLSIVAHINATCRFQEVFVYRSFSFTETKVSDVPSAGSGSFALNYSLGISDGGERTYVDVQNSVNVNASLFGLPVYNASASVVTARLVSRSATNSSGWTAVPSNCNFLRVKSACQLNPSMGSPLADVDHNGVVDATDYWDILWSEYHVLGDSKYNWSLDLNGDGVINQADLDIVGSSLNLSVTYLGGGDYDYSGVRVDFDNGWSVHLDSRGFVGVPSGVHWLNMSIGGIVEFFSADTAQNVSTDNMGIAGANWSPSSVGLYVVQAKLPSTFNVTWSTEMAQAPWITHVSASLNVANYFYVLKRLVDFSVNLQANVSYILPLYTNITVGAMDHVTQQPISNLPMNITVGNTLYFVDVCTDSSGLVVEPWVFQSNIVCNINASCSDWGDNAASAGSSSFDFRWPTNIASQAGNITTVTAGFDTVLSFDLTDCDSCGVGGMLVHFYVNGSSYNGVSYVPHNWVYTGTTLSNGTASFMWTVPTGNGAYSVIAVFNGASLYGPSQVCVGVTANSVPLGILFSVTPAEFVPGTTVFLNATVMDVSSNTLFTWQNVSVNFTRVDSNGAVSYIGVNCTNSTGKAYLSNQYPTGGNAYAYKAEVVPDYAGGNLRQGIAGSPVQLSVASSTVLLLDVSRDNSSTEHLVEGWLKSGGSGVPNKTVTVKVNDDVYSKTTRSPDGYFNLNLNLQPKNPNGQSAYENVTYYIQASFAGDTPVNATALANMLDGTSYAACTTVQCGYKPCSNSTVLTVDPQSSQAATLTKTPEEMQQEAKRNGTLRDYDEWSWWYPWYRRHFVYVYEGVEQFDQGISPIPLVAETLKCADAFLSILRTLWSVVVWPTVVAVFTAEFFALIACNTGPWGFALALGISIGNKMLSAGLNWNSIGNLAGAVIGNVFSTVYGMLKWTWALASGVLKLLMGTISLMSFGLGNVYRIFSFFSNVFYIGTIMTRLHELGAIA